MKRESKTSPRMMKGHERTLQALQLRASGATYDQIALALGYANRSCAFQAVQRGLRMTLREPADQVRDLELQRLDRLQAALWARAIKGGYRAIETILKLMDRRAKLMGLDAPTRVDITQTIRQVAEDNGLPVDQVMAEAERIIRGM